MAIVVTLVWGGVGASLSAPEEETTTTRITVSPDSRYAVQFRPKPGEEEFTWETVVLQWPDKKELLREEVHPYAQELEAWAAWNADSSIVAVGVKQHRHGLDSYFYAVADGKVQTVVPAAALSSMIEEGREVWHKSWYNPVAWLSPREYLYQYKLVTHAKNTTATEDMDWKEEYGYHVWQFRNEREGNIVPINLTTSDDIEERYAGADAELNYFYQRALKETKKEGAPALLKAQRAWLSFRDAEVIARILTVNATTTESLFNLTRDRADQLRQIVKSDL